MTWRARCGVMGPANGGLRGHLGCYVCMSHAGGLDHGWSERVAGVRTILEGGAECERSSGCWDGDMVGDRGPVWVGASIRDLACQAGLQPWLRVYIRNTYIYT